MPPSTSRRAGRSKTSARHSRYVSTRIGKLPYRLATPSRSAARWRCCQSGVREPRPGSVLAEGRSEEGGATGGGHHQVLDRLRVGEERLLHAVQVALRQADGDPVVRPDRGDLLAQPLAKASLDRQRPGGVDAAPERRKEDQPPVTQLVAEAFHHDPAVGREGARRLALVLEVRDEVLRGQRV